MKIQWYPGHMTKAKREMEEQIKIIDLLIQLCDARVVFSSLNPDFDVLGKNKFRMVLLNKADLADKKITAQWIQWFKSKNIMAIPVDSRKRDWKKDVTSAIETVCREKRERDKKRGLLNRPVRAMVVGIPNVGKSTFINSFSGRASAKTGNKPGVTKGNQWIRFGKDVELLDTPGVLWPKFEDEEIGTHLAMIGSINDDLVDSFELAMEISKFLRERYPDAYSKRYPISFDTDDLKNIERIGIARHALKKGDEIDLEKAAGILIDDFRKGILGPISIELPKE